MNWYISAWKNYAEFEGRAHRPEYWYFVLFNTLAIIVSILVDMVLGTTTSGPSPVGLIQVLYGLASFVPSLAVGVRRLHDSNRTGWWVLILFIPFLGALIFLVFMVLRSDPNDNQYGPRWTEQTARPSPAT